MKATTRQSVRRRGAALVLAVVVTVLLAVVGVMFVMVARVGEMQTGAVIDNADLDAAVQSVTSRIEQTLTQDLFGEKLNEKIGQNGPHYTWPGVKKSGNPAEDDRITPWLADLEPDVASSQWVHITDLTDDTVTLSKGVATIIIPDYQKKEDVAIDKPADADGDGVADSRWIQLPNTFTSRGKPIFAAVRIIDNCAMLNLNTAFGFFKGPTDTREWHSNPWYSHISLTNPSNGWPYYISNYGQELGKYISEVNYGPFLRGDDRGKIERIRLSRNSKYDIFPDEYHRDAIINIESPSGNYRLFDLGDELEMRNRFLLTSLVQARFEREGVAYNTFDWKRGEFAGGWKVALKVKRIPYDAKNEDDDEDLIMWRTRLNSANFDDTDPANKKAFYYDRRHISTFYSFDRPLRTGQYPLLDAALEKIYKQLIDGGMKKTQAAERLRKIEFVFRPLDNRPLDLRAMTSPTESALTANTRQARSNVLQLLYGLRAAYMAQGMAASVAAKAACQFVVNLIDYCDDDAATASGVFGNADYGSQINKNPTYLNQTLINRMIVEVSENDPLVVGNSELDFGLEPTETLYGFERQPFITEVFTAVDNDAGGVLRFAVELYNPYDAEIDVSGWRFTIDGTPTTAAVANTKIQPQKQFVFCSHTPDNTQLKVTGTAYLVLSGLVITNTTQKVVLERPIGTEFLPVDIVPRSYITDLTVDPAGGGATYHSIKRDNKRDNNGWAFTDVSATEHKSSSTNDFVLGQPNAVDEKEPTDKGYQLPVANSGTIERLTDFLKVVRISNQKGGATAKTITEQVAEAGNESAIRLDLLNDGHKKILDYVCFLNRPQGSLPGRININTAAVHVIAAAIPPQLVIADVADTEHALYLAEQIVANRPYQRVSDLLNIPAFQKFKNHATVNVGDLGIRGDFEDRDWIVSRLANIFTVRSDTFTAYILVRLGADGPQRRMIAIFDRTNVWTKDDRPRLVALHPVPDPR